MTKEEIISQKDKEDALDEIMTIARSHGLTLSEVVAAFRESDRRAKHRASDSIISRLLGYLGGIFVFAGICIFISMQWSDMGSAARVIITLGTGFVAMLMALLALSDEKFERAATPLTLVACLLQAVGLGVLLKEYGFGGNPDVGALFMAGSLLIQQVLLFIAKRRSVMLFASFLFGSIAFVSAARLLDINGHFIGMTLGFSLLCLSFAADQSRNRAVAPFWYLMGATLLLCASFDLFKGSALEALFIGLAAAMIYLSATVRSRTLLFASTLGMLGYIGYFTAQNFSNTLGWPITLVLLGLALILMGALALKINNKYIQAKE